MSEDLFPAMRDAVIAAPGVIEELGNWRGEPAVFTRRPVPADAEMVLALINPPTSITDAGGLAPGRSRIVHDIVIYGQKGTPGSGSDETRQVERAAFALKEHFHRNRFSVQPAGFHVIGVTATGPVPAPVDDDATVARLVTVAVTLRRAL